MVFNDAKNSDWLPAFIRETRYYEKCAECSDSGNSQQTVCKYFDLDSAGVRCGCCLSEAGHRILQIRRSSLANVVKKEDFAQFADVNGVQTYVINNIKVLFISCRPVCAKAKSKDTKRCVVCSRSIQDSHKYCCIQCKYEDEAGEPASSGISTADAIPVSSADTSSHDGAQSYRETSSKRLHYRKTTLENSLTSAKRRKLSHPHRAPMY